MARMKVIDAGQNQTCKKIEQLGFQLLALDFRTWVSGFGSGFPHMARQRGGGARGGGKAPLATGGPEDHAAEHNLTGAPKVYFLLFAF